MDFQEQKKSLDQPGPCYIPAEMLRLANTTISNSTNATVDQSHSQFNIFTRDSGSTEKDAGLVIMEGVRAMRAKYKDIERRRSACQWNDALNLDLEKDYLIQELSLIAKGKEQKASRTISTAELMAVLNQEKRHRFLLEGDFSTGKTTLCRYLFYNWMCGKDLESYTLVMWLPLRRVRRKSILEGLFESFKEMSSVWKVKLEEFEEFIVSESERVLLLLDGLDETGSKEQADIFQILRRNRFPYLSILATSRPIPEDIPLDCSRYIVRGVSKRCVDEFLLNLGPNIEGIVRRKITHNLLCRPLLLKFIVVLARNKEQFIALPTGYNLYERMLLYMIKNLTEKYPDRYSSKNKKIVNVAEPFLNHLEDIAFDLLVKNTLMMEKNELMNCHHLTDVDVEDQQKLGILAFYTNFTEDGLDEEEVCEFPLKPFAEILAMMHVKKLLVGGVLSVEDLHSVFYVFDCDQVTHSKEELKGRFVMDNWELTVFLFTLLSDHTDICLKVYQYFCSRYACFQRGYASLRVHFAYGDVVCVNIMVSVLAALKGRSKIECCQHFLSKYSEMGLYESRFNDETSLFESGLLYLIESSPNVVSICFHDPDTLLWTSCAYVEKFHPMEFKIRRRDIAWKKFLPFSDENAEWLLRTPEIKDALLKLNKRVRIEFLQIEIRTLEFTAKGMKAIQWLVENLPISRIELKLDIDGLSELGRIHNLSLEVARRTKLEFCYTSDYRVTWLEEDGVHSYSHRDFEDEFEVKVCDVCEIGRKYDFLDITNPSRGIVVPNKETVENVEETTSVLDTTWVGKQKHGAAFCIKYHDIDAVFSCTCGGVFSQDYAKCNDYCSCGRDGLVNESGLFTVPFKCTSCFTVREERCCDIDLEITCPHCRKVLQDNDFQSGNLLKMASDLVVHDFKSSISNWKTRFDPCTSCRSRTLQVLKCPGCAQDFDIDVSTLKSPFHRKDRMCYICCTYCRNTMLPGYSCRNEACKYFGVGRASMHTREKS